MGYLGNFTKRTVTLFCGLVLLSFLSCATTNRGLTANLPHSMVEPGTSRAVTSLSTNVVSNSRMVTSFDSLVQTAILEDLNSGVFTKVFTDDFPILGFLSEPYFVYRMKSSLFDTLVGGGFQYMPAPLTRLPDPYCSLEVARNIGGFNPYLGVQYFGTSLNLHTGLDADIMPYRIGVQLQYNRYGGLTLPEQQYGVTVSIGKTN